MRHPVEVAHVLEREHVRPADAEADDGDCGWVAFVHPPCVPRLRPPPRGKVACMADELKGQTIAFLATEGVEQVELTEPWKAVEQAGGTPKLVSIDGR